MIDIQTHVISLSVLTVIFFHMIRSKTRRFFINVIFYFLIIFNFSILVIDALTLLFNGGQDSISIIMHPIVVFLYYFMHVIAIGAWVFYIDYHIFQDIKRFIYLMAITSPIGIASTVLSALSISGDFYFYIDPNNVYHRGKYFLILPLLCFLLLLIAQTELLIYRYKIKKSDFWSLLLFPIPPLIAAIVQIFIFNVTLIWPFMAVSILAVYIGVQSKITSTDTLTGVYNRREYEFVINQKSIGNKAVGGIMIDVNNLKLINDNYMHHVGDMALVKLAEILKKSVRKDDFIARIGGDEFIIIFDANEKEALKNIVTRIKENLEHFNSENIHPFELSVSIGYGIYDASKFKGFKEFIQELDIKMYMSKNEIKSNI